MDKVGVGWSLFCSVFVVRLFGGGCCVTVMILIDGDNKWPLLAFGNERFLCMYVWGNYGLAVIVQDRRTVT